MRVLHPGDDHGQQGAAGREPHPHPGRDPAGPEGQHLPLHRLPADLRRRGEGRRVDGGSDGVAGRLAARPWAAWAAPPSSSTACRASRDSSRTRTTCSFPRCSRAPSSGPTTRTRGSWGSTRARRSPPPASIASSPPTTSPASTRTAGRCPTSRSSATTTCASPATRSRSSSPTPASTRRRRRRSSAVEYEPLPGLYSPQDALAADAPQLVYSAPGNVCKALRPRDRRHRGGLRVGGARRGGAFRDPAPGSRLPRAARLRGRGLERRHGGRPDPDPGAVRDA